MRLLRSLGTYVSFATNGGLMALALSMAFPGTHRAIAPASFGMVEIAPRVWSDAPARRTSHLQMIAEARGTIARFFQSEATTPLILLCSTRTCARSFGIGGNGLSIADLIVMVAPGGLNTGTLTHEFSHSWLHQSMGLRNLVDHPYPTWFDEGLATHVAGHPRWRGTISADHIARVRRARHVWHWRGTMADLGVGRAYASAAAEVARIERKVGRAGLLELIARADAGEDFDALEAGIGR